MTQTASVPAPTPIALPAKRQRRSRPARDGWWPRLQFATAAVLVLGLLVSGPKWANDAGLVLDELTLASAASVELPQAAWSIRTVDGPLGMWSRTPDGDLPRPSQTLNPHSTSVHNLAFIEDPELPTGQAGVVLDVAALPEGSQPFRTGPDINIVSLLSGDATVQSGVGEITISSPAKFTPSAERYRLPEPIGINGTASLSPGTTVTGHPGSTFNITVTQVSPVLQVSISPSPANAEGTTAPDSATPGVATPVTSNDEPDLGQPGCDVGPRTVAEIEALIADADANPVDLLRLSLREQQGTGIPTDSVTVDAITRTLREVSECNAARDDLRLLALLTDDSLRGLFTLDPNILGTVSEFPTLPPEPPQQGLTAPRVLVSDVELFADGRVGARVILDDEFAYVTFAQADDGTWLIDIFDDRDEDELFGTPAASTPIVTPANP